MQVEKNVDLKRFLEFLKCDRQVLQFKHDANTYSFVKLPYDDDTFAIFGCYGYIGKKDISYCSLGYGSHLEYQGFFSKKTETIYDSGSSMNSLFEFPTLSLEDLRKQFVQELKAHVTEYVRNHMDEFPADPNNPEKEIMETACKRALGAFYKSETVVPFDLYFLFDTTFTERKIVSYVNDRERTLRRRTKMYLSKYKSQLGCELMVNRKAQDLLDKIHADKSCGPQRRLAIAKSIGDQVTVKVTIHKDGQEFQFRSTTNDLTTLIQDYYSNYYINAKDRKEYKKLFGDVSYNENEVVRICHGHNVLYECQNG